ncbi:protein Vhl [Condylostylus longicornis]|uniref:protein Vhl n=1 Tax=Condylostylus longicornis TaxID=2530218 RepID=UPI00244DC91F|nr:protein Vhl [Condylostylus longicornis]
MMDRFKNALEHALLNMERYNPNLRSKESIHSAFLLFVNTTEREVNVYWVDYQGRFVQYKKLEPGDRTVINTFSTHPWIFRDSNSGERMHAENKEVFWPKPFFSDSHLSNNIPESKRKQIHIHFPLRSLRENSLWAIAKLIRPTYIDQLEIPMVLKVELREVYKDYRNFKASAAAYNFYRR